MQSRLNLPMAVPRSSARILTALFISTARTQTVTVWTETPHAKQLCKSWKPILLTPALENPKGQNSNVPNFCKCFKPKLCPEFKPTQHHWFCRILLKWELVWRDTTSILLFWLTGRNFASEVTRPNIWSVCYYYSPSPTETTNRK